MKISDHDLRQLDAASIRRLVVEQPQAVEPLMVRLVEDLKEARERLNQNPDNSSRPSSTREPWSRADVPPPESQTNAPPADDGAADTPTSKGPPAKKKSSSTPSRPAGRQKGARGHGRTQKLAVTHTQDHRPCQCARCGGALPPELAVGYSGFQEADVVFGTEQHPGLHLILTQHGLFATICPQCGHETRAEPYRAPPVGGDWAGVELTAWRLIGPALAALLVWTHFDLHLSVRKCRRLCWELFGISLSEGAILEAIHESGRACAPIPPRIQEEVRQAALAYSDETPHYQAGEFLWLWVLSCATSVLYFVGRRTKETLRGRIGIDFAGWLMSDGYGAYREYRRRLRCWAHLIRKARALAETYTPHVQGYGNRLLETFDRLIDQVYQAREGPPTDLRPKLASELAELKRLCEKMKRSRNEKARQLGVEFLNDWEAIFQVLAHPEMPLTNNFSERLLRHWVILRRITHGTRTPQGSLVLATFASIIGTCHLRQASPLRYLHQVIAARRQGLDAPPLPPIPVMA